MDPDGNPRYFPMKDGPPIPWPLAEIIHTAHLRVFPSSMTIQQVQAAGGFLWSQVPVAFANVRKRDTILYNDLIAAAKGWWDGSSTLALPHLGSLGPEAQEIEEQRKETEREIQTHRPQVDPLKLPLTIVCWKWAAPNSRVRYTQQHVATLHRMVQRHYSNPFRFICITDNLGDVPKGVEAFPLWRDCSALSNPNGMHLPSCYRRLKLFSKEVGDQLGPGRIVSLDLDVIITGDLRPVWDRPEPFVGWSVPSAAMTTAYNGSMWMLVPGPYQWIWDKFDPHRSPALAHRARYYGSDQGWLSFCLKGKAPGWNGANGVYSFPREVRPLGRLPHNARMIIFHGGVKPWDSGQLRSHPWVRNHYK